MVSDSSHIPSFWIQPGEKFGVIVFTALAGATVPSSRRELGAKAIQFATEEGQALNVGAQLHCVSTEGLCESL